MPLQKIPDYYPVRITWLENAVENIGILEKSGVSDYTPFGSIISERSWSLPDDCNTYTSLYFDKPLDLDFSDGCGTWTKFGRSSVNIYCYSNYGYMTLTSNGDNSGVYTEILTEIDSTYVLTIDITSLTQYTSWAVYVRDDQSNIIASTTISQTGEINFDFTATSTTTRIEILRISGFGTSSISITQLSVIGKYHKEDVMYLSYRYGFNNMEKDDELKGHGNSYDFGARIYDPRVGSWLAVDPLAGKYPDLSPYVFVANSPLIFVDPDGRKIKVTVVYENNEPVVKVTVSGKIIDLSKTWPIDIEGIAENLNEYGSKYFDREMDVSNINFGTKNDPLYLTGNVKVDITFAFEATNSLSNVKPDDHLLSLVNFDPVELSYYGEIREVVATGVADYCGLCSFVDADYFSGPIDFFTGIGYNIALHEIITHNFGLKHTNNKNDVTYGKGVNYNSKNLSDQQIRTIINKTLMGQLNQGPNTIGSSRTGTKRPNTSINDDKNSYNAVDDAGVRFSNLKKQQ